MKNIFVITILAMVLSSCASGGKINNSADSPVSLEVAIELAAEHIANDLTPGTRIAIVDFESENENLSHHIMEELTGEMLKYKIEIADRQNLPYIFQEFRFQMSGAVSDETAQSLGKIIGAELIVVGRLLDIVEMYRNQVDAVHVERSTRESAARNNVRKDRALQRMIKALANQQTTVKVYRYGVTEQTNPETAGIFLDRGIMYAMRGEYDKAIADFDEALRLNPNLVGAYILRGRALVASVSKVTDVADNFRGVTTTSTGGNAISEQNRVFELAVASFDRAIRLEPDNAVAYRERGRVYGEIGDFDKALTEYNEAIRLNPKDPWAYCNRGVAYSYKEDYDRAIADYNEAIRLDPKDAVPYNSRGNVYSDKKDYDRAMTDYNQAIRLDPDDAVAYNNRGVLYYDKKDYDRAIADYNQAISLDPKDAEPYYNRANAYYVKRDYDHAIADYEATLRIDSNHANAKIGLENARQARGR